MPQAALPATMPSFRAAHQETLTTVSQRAIMTGVAALRWTMGW
jgi:hypothetical protein